MTKAGGSFLRRDFAIVIAALAVVGAVFCAIPHFGRALDILLAALAVSGVAVAVAARNNWLRSLAVVVVSLALALFAVEMLQKVFGIISPVRQKITAGGQDSKYGWTLGYGPSYIDARDKALADGLPLEGRFAGEIFAGVPRSELHVVSTDSVLKDIKGGTESLKPLYTYETPLGYELSPGNRWRGYARESGTERVLFDHSVITDENGLRVTRGDAGSKDTFLFLGCSFTYGTYLNDDETLPYRFSELAGFDDNVVNLGIGGWGPAHVLRDLELDRRTGKAVRDPGSVKMVVYTLINDHANRVSSALYGPTPQYALRNGALELQGMIDENAPKGFFTSRFDRLLDKSRVWKALSARLWARMKSEHNWELVVAALARIDAICRERYGVPLTVVYWDGTQQVVEALELKGVETLPVEPAFATGDGRKLESVQYMLFDGHPSALGNRKVAELLFHKAIERGDTR